MRPIGTEEELERRRRRAVELVRQGEAPDEVAHCLGSGRSSVYTWLELDAAGVFALAVGVDAAPSAVISRADVLGSARDEPELNGLAVSRQKALGPRPPVLFGTSRIRIAGVVPLPADWLRGPIPMRAGVRSLAGAIAPIMPSCDGTASGRIGSART